MRRQLRFLLRWTLLLLAGLILLVGGSDYWVRQQAAGHLFHELTALPAYEVGLVLGTSRRLSNGQENLFFRFRMDAAAKLYHAGKVRHLIVSGDNSMKSYNEPREMRKALIARGVPAEAITLDFAGFRTLDSIVRCREIFGQHAFVVISQPFHNARAVFIGRAKGMEVTGFNARGVSATAAQRVYLREWFARTKAVLDVYLLHTEPRFLGEKIPLTQR